MSQLLLPSVLVVKRTAKLLERLLPHLTHSQALEWSAQLHAFPDWHSAQRSNQLIPRPVTALERDEACDDPLGDKRLEVALRLLGKPPDFHEDQDAMELLMFLGMTDIPCLGTLSRIGVIVLSGQIDTVGAESEARRGLQRLVPSIQLRSRSSSSGGFAWPAMNSGT